jgi:hypothetical protein
MTVSKKPAKISEAEVNNIIAGGGSIPNESSPKPPEEVRITISIPGELTEVIDRLRKPTKTSRRTWLLQAAYEKLKRDGEI